jgi:hypothetical protein
MEASEEPFKDFKGVSLSGTEDKDIESSSSCHMTSTGRLAATFGSGSRGKLCLLIALEDVVSDGSPSVEVQLDAREIPSSSRQPGRDFK